MVFTRVLSFECFFSSLTSSRVQSRRTTRSPCFLLRVAGALPVFRAGRFAAVFLVAVLRIDFFVTGFRADAGFAARFVLPRDLAAALLGLVITLAALVVTEATASLTALPAA